MRHPSPHGQTKSQNMATVRVATELEAGTTYSDWAMAVSTVAEATV